MDTISVFREEKILMKKIIFSIILLALFLIACSPQTETTQPTKASQSPNVGGGCNVAPQIQDNNNIKYIWIADAL